MNDLNVNTISSDNCEYPDKLKILFVDDDQFNIETFIASFQDEYRIIAATSGEQALDIYNSENDIALVISDQRMPGMTGVELLSRILKINPESIRIIITGYMDVDDILDSINKGHIYQYILKPWDDMQVRLVLDHAAQTWLLAWKNKVLGEKIRNKNTLLERANENLRISESRLHHLSSVLIAAIEDERRKISMELYDEMGQSLAAVKLLIKLIENKFVSILPEPDEMHLHCDEVRNLLNKIIENVRRLSNDLSPVIIDELGIDFAIENLVMNFSRHSGIKCDFNSESIQSYFSTSDRYHIYRIFQDILNNVHHHSNANLLSIVIQNKKKVVSIEITDNGKGFDVEEVMNRPTNSRGIGLSALTQRMNILNGSVKITSKPGEGTSVLLTIPILQEIPSQK